MGRLSSPHNVRTLRRDTRGEWTQEAGPGPRELRQYPMSDIIRPDPTLQTPRIYKRVRTFLNRSRWSCGVCEGRCINFEHIKAAAYHWLRCEHEYFKLASDPWDGEHPDVIARVARERAW